MSGYDLSSFPAFCTSLPGDSSVEMSGYASLFKENNITGKRLLLLDEEDLKDMGIVSKGHIIHFKVPGGRVSINQCVVW